MRVIWDIFIGDVRSLFRNVIAAIVVMGLALVPPMYAWFTTLGFWDPYSNTGSIKVAVASEDAGYTSNLIPTPINAGEQIIGKLRANDQFAWQFVSADEAARGVRSPPRGPEILRAASDMAMLASREAKIQVRFTPSARR